jgi:hypothetical protein
MHNVNCLCSTLRMDTRYTVESGYTEREKCMKTGSLYPRFTKNENKIYHVDYRFNVQLVAKKTGKEFFSNVNLVLSICQLTL